MNNARDLAARGEDGRAIPGFAMEDAKEVFGDETELAMDWKSGSDLTSLAGRTIVLHFELKDADVYSYRFRSRGRILQGCSGANSWTTADTPCAAQ